MAGAAREEAGLPDALLDAAGFRRVRPLPGGWGRHLLVRPEAPGRRWLLRRWDHPGRPVGDGHPLELPFTALGADAHGTWGVHALGAGRLLAELPGPQALPEALWAAWEAATAAGRLWLRPESLVWGPEGLREVAGDREALSTASPRRATDARARFGATARPAASAAWAGITSAGVLRVLNEDTWRVTDAGGQRLAVVVDGLGGFNAGELAAFVVADAFAATAGPTPRQRLDAGLAAARAWFGGYDGPERGFGASFLAAVLEGGRVTLGWMGDVRAFRVCPRGVEPLTVEHTLGREMVRHGKLRPEELRGHRLAPILLRIVGHDVGDAEMEVVEAELSPGDHLLLASNGLWELLDEAALDTILKKARGPRDGVVRLHGAALEAGAPDNVTALLLAV